jgi:hypothetical protein
MEKTILTGVINQTYKSKFEIENPKSEIKKANFSEF